MTTKYQPQTLDMIYKMVHKEHKTMAEIADELCVYVDRIEDVYKAALENLKFCYTKPVKTLVIKTKVA